MEPTTTTTTSPEGQPWMTILLLLGLGLVFLNPQGCSPNPSSPNPTTKATAATYVYEKDQTAIPSGVLAGLNRLNLDRLDDSFIGSVFEQDTMDGDGQVPDQYKVPLKAAQDAGLPALVVTSGATVLRVVKNPQTEQEVTGAVP